MYEEYYGLSADPFRLSPVGDRSYEHSSYRKARSYLEYVLHRREGIILISGKPGTGKTTLVKAAASSLKSSHINLNVLSCNKLDAQGLLKLYVSDLGIQSRAEDSGSLLVDIEREILRLGRSNINSVLVLDEAQGLTCGALETARLLTNIQIEDRPLLQLILVGQPKLLQKIVSPALVQLHQRIISSTTLQELTLAETKDYFMHRLNSVDWINNPFFHDEVFRILYESSEGNPRWINQIGSRLLLHGMVEGKSEITAEEIRKVVIDLVEEKLLPNSVRSTHTKAVAFGGGLIDFEL